MTTRAKLSAQTAAEVSAVMNHLLKEAKIKISDDTVFGSQHVPNEFIQTAINTALSHAVKKVINASKHGHDKVSLYEKTPARPKGDAKISSNKKRIAVVDEAPVEKGDATPYFAFCTKKYGEGKMFCVWHALGRCNQPCSTRGDSTVCFSNKTGKFFHHMANEKGAWSIIEGVYMRKSSEDVAHVLGDDGLVEAVSTDTDDDEVVVE
jgi:hypothetical protein